MDAYWSVHEGDVEGPVVASGIADKHCKLTRQYINSCETPAMSKQVKKMSLSKEASHLTGGQETQEYAIHTLLVHSLVLHILTFPASYLYSRCMDYVVTMSDSFGDGWQDTHLYVGNALTYTMVPEPGDSLYTYFTDSLSYREKVACLPCGETLEVFACGGDFSEEVSWAIQQVTSFL